MSAEQLLAAAPRLEVVAELEGGAPRAHLVVRALTEGPRLLADLLGRRDLHAEILQAVDEALLRGVEIRDELADRPGAIVVILGPGRQAAAHVPIAGDEQRALDWLSGADVHGEIRQAVAELTASLAGRETGRAA